MSKYSFQLATVQHRLGGKALDLALYFVTFGIGWFIWSMVIWGQGQTPGKQILKMRVYNKITGSPAKWGQMAIREFLLPLAFFLVLLPFVLVMSLIPDQAIQLAAVMLLYFGIFLITLIDAVWIFRNNNFNRLVDFFAKTDVLNESS